MYTLHIIHKLYERLGYGRTNQKLLPPALVRDMKPLYSSDPERALTRGFLVCLPIAEDVRILVAFGRGKCGHHAVGYSGCRVLAGHNGLHCGSAGCWELGVGICWGEHRHMRTNFTTTIEIVGNLEC